MRAKIVWIVWVLLCASVTSAAAQPFALAGPPVAIGVGWEIRALRMPDIYVPTGPSALVYQPTTGAWYLVAWLHPQRHGLNGHEPGAGVCYETDGSRWPRHAQITIADVGSPGPWREGRPDGVDDIQIYDPASGQTATLLTLGFSACDTADIGGAR